MSSYMIVSSDELCHYGIRGQKWGIRRFQNEDGTLTAEGQKRYGSVKEMKKQARKEYKLDNKNAFQLGKRATIDAQAAEYAKGKMEKSGDKLKKANESGNDKQKANAFRKAEDDYYNYMVLKSRSIQSEALAKEHYKELVKKYGKEHVSEISRDEKGVMNERVESFLTSALKAGLVGALAGPYAGGVAANVYSMNAPVYAGQKAYRQYTHEVKQQEKKVQKHLKQAIKNSPYKNWKAEGYN